MVLTAGSGDSLATALALAALAGDRDPWRGRGPDLASRLADWHNAPAGLLRIYRELCRRQGVSPVGPNPALAGWCAARAFPDRIAQRRAAGAAELRLANGRGARLADAREFADADFVVVWESEDRGSDALVRLAATLDSATLEAVAGERSETNEVLTFDPLRRRVTAESRRVLDALVLARRPITPRPEAALGCLIDGLRGHGLHLLPWSEPLRQLRCRLGLLHRADAAAWPAVDDATILAELEIWLGPRLAGATSLASLDADDLRRALLGRVDPARLGDLERLAPATWTTPLGTRIAIDYAQDPPVLACRLQELFGQSHHPTIMEDRLPLALHLLSPAGRPIQVTRDLAGFWQGSYAAVRKDLRGRYPKHPWPEDPSTASPWRPGQRRPGQRRPGQQRPG